MANLLAILGADGRTTRAMLAGAALRHAARETGCKLDVDEPVSYTHLTLPTTTPQCRSRWSPYH